MVPPEQAQLSVAVGGRPMRQKVGHLWAAILLAANVSPKVQFCNYIHLLDSCEPGSGEPGSGEVSLGPLAAVPVAVLCSLPGREQASVCSVIVFFFL